jgi:hypothetical protein
MSLLRSLCGWTEMDKRAGERLSGPSDLCQRISVDVPYTHRHARSFGLTPRL